MNRPPRRPGKRLLGKLILWRCFFVSVLLVVCVLGMYEWGNVEGRTLGQRRAEAFNTLVGPRGGGTLAEGAAFAEAVALERGRKSGSFCTRVGRFKRSGQCSFGHPVLVWGL
jgi:hypothetical protein